MKMSDVKVGMRLRSIFAPYLPATVTKLTERGFEYHLDGPVPFIAREGAFMTVDGHEHFGFCGEAYFEPEETVPTPHRGGDTVTGRTYENGETHGIRWAISWLHARAEEMGDPHAKAILNTAAFNMGTARNRTALSPLPSEEMVRGLVTALAFISAQRGKTLISLDGGHPYSLGAHDAFQQMANEADAALAAILPRLEEETR